ncbi:autotransporter-associated beta strand repeat-containing protein [Bordetella genomosp. 13]|uniref:autotransporter-associated beta strand repeat-containing protein n=1 Tax=Bordetella genomosp. 13 TaxID=463040 RepID=UPI0011AAB6F5|nr:autotransporter-associated beta strand repeat-containing protein [Bordetella genomosp. 13]
MSFSVRASRTNDFLKLKLLPLSILAALAGVGSPDAYAACTTAGSNVTCSGAANPLAPSYANGANNLNVTVNPGGSVGVLLGVGGNAMTLTGSNDTLTNNGRIDPVLLGTGLGVLSSGVVMGNASASTQTVTNNGILGGTTGLSIGLTGMALAVQNGAGGTTNITNTGTMTTTGIVGATLLGPDAGVMAAYGGGQVNVNNSGTITGRVALGSSAGGNTFTNSGTVNGSVSMGANSTNQFIATTDSAVNSAGGTGLATNLGIGAVTINFAATGTVDGGAGGNNTLSLQQGAAATGTINNGNYVNFNHLDVQSGTWNLDGASSALDATLGNGATAIVNNTASLGTGTITANGGAIQSATPGLTLGNDITATGNGLGVTGSSSMTLAGTISGGGTVTQSGTGTLTLSGANVYTGGTALNAGTLVVGNNQAMGTGTLTVGGNATLDSSQAVTLGNDVAVNSGASLALGGSNAMGISGDITGDGGLVKNGAATVTLTGANTYTGGTTINAGTLALGAGGSLAPTGTVNLAGAGATFDISGSGANQTVGGLAGAAGTSVALGANALTFGDSGNQTFGGTIGGTGGVVKQGSGTQTLTGANTYTGGTTINGGTLALGAGGSLAATGDVTLGTAGAGFDISGAGANQTIGGLAGVAGTTVALGGNTLSFGTADDKTFGGAIGGTGGIVKQGSGTQTLTGANTYTGGTTISAGTLAISGGGSLSTQGTVNLANAGTAFDIGGATSNQAIGGLAGAAGSSVLLGSNTLTFGDAGNHTFGGTIGGTGGIIKEGAGTQTLTGANAYTGATTINAGTLVLGAGGSLAATSDVNLGGAGATFDISQSGAAQTIGGLSGVAGTIVSLGGNALTFGDEANRDFGGAITGTAGITKQGAGTTTLTGANTYTGGTTINGGTLALGAGGSLAAGGSVTLGAAGAGFDIGNSGANQTIGALAGVGGTTIALGANTLTFGDATDQGYAGVIGGTGGIVKQGAGTQTLTGINTYTGGTTINAGTLAIGAGGSLSGQTALTLANAGTVFDISGATTPQTIGGLDGAAGSTVQLGANTLALGDAGNHAYGGVIEGTGGITKQGAGTLTLTGDQTYSGGTTINAGTLALGGGGSLAATGSVTLGAAGATFDISGSGADQTIGALSGVAGTAVALGAQDLAFGDATNQTFGGTIGGTGGIVKQGSGTQTLTGANTYTGGTTINAGTLAIGTGGSLGAQGTVTLANAGTAFDISGATTSQTIGGLAGAAGSSVALGGNTLTFGDAGNHTFGGVIGGTGGITKEGTGTQTLAGANTYTGATTINAGTLVLGAGGSLAAASDVNLGGAGATFDISGSGAAQTIGGLSGVAGTTVSLGGNALTFGDEANRTFGGSITGTAGITKQGTGVTTLTGANTYTGGTTINVGTLALGAGGSLAATGSVTLGAAGAGFDIGNSGANQTIGALAGVGGTTIALGANTLTFGDASNQAYGGVIVGTGAVVKQGSGTQTLTGANTYTGGTTIDGGTLAISGSGSLSAQGTVNLANAGTAFDISGATSNQAIGGLAGAAGSSVLLGSNTLTFGDAGNHTFRGSIGGTGGITKEGSGTQTLTGANTYTGATTINAGTLVLGAGGSLGAASDVNLGGTGAAFDISGSGAAQTIGGLSGVAGTTVSLGGNALAFGDEANRTFGGSITGTAGITKQGTGTTTLTGANTYTGGTTINGGTLAIGAGGSLAATGNVTLGAAGAGFDLSGATTPQTIAGLSGVAGTTLALGGNTLTFGDTAARSYAGTITGTGGLVKQGSGSITLAGANTYTGGTTVNAGTVALGAGGSLAATGLVTLANAGAAFDISASGANQTIGGLAGAAGTTVALGTHTLTLGNAGNQAFGGVIGGTGGLVKQGTGTMTLTGANTYTGTTEIKAGTLALGAGGSLASGGGVNLSGTGAAFDIANSGANQTLGSLNGVAGTTVALGAHTLTVGNAAAQAYAGTISGTGGLVKQGTGTLTLAGANTYTGGTTINAGTLALGAGGALAATGSVALANANTAFDISGAGADQTIGALSGGVSTTVALGGRTLTLGTGGNQSYGGVITGTGGLVKQGTGGLTLTGVNTYTGGTTIRAGSVALAAGGVLSSTGTVDLAGTGATFDIGGAAGDRVVGGLRGVTGTSVALGANSLSLGGAADDAFGGSISGTGGITKQGSGRATLTGANTYTGGTTVNVGTLALGAGGSLASTGRLGLNGTSVFDISASGADQTIGGFSGASGTQVVLGPNRLIFGDASDQQYAGVISGTGGIVKQGSGTQTLTGANTYTGGTQVVAGTLVGDSTSLQGDIDNAATLVFDQSVDGTYGGEVSGAGTLVKDGAGVLTLAGANTYTGGTRIDQGTLQGDASSLRGDIENNANLVFQQQADGTYAGTLTGAGALAKDGAGTLILSADSGAYAGSTAVRAGTLQVDGKLGGTMAVQSGGTLGGTGTVGATTIASGGTLAPGNAAAPKGTLTVAGNLVFSPGATYQVRTDPTGAQSMVHATGTASLAGGVLILGEQGNYALSTNYNILTADGGLLGRFDTVRSNLAFLTPDLQYTATGIGLEMSLKDVDGGGSTPSRPIRFADLAENGNQRAVANALQSLPSSSNLYSRVLNLPEGAPAGVFASLSGEAHASVQQSLQNVSDRVMDTSISHLRANLNAGVQPGAPTAQLGRGDASAMPQSAVKPAWAQVFGGWSRQSGGGDTARVSESSGGVFLGGDGDVGGGWRLGGAFGYADGNANLRSLSSSSDLNSYSAAIYGGKAFPAARGQVNVSLGAGYTWHDVKTKRNVNAAGVPQELKADYNASTAQVFGEVGYAIKLDERYTLEPFVGAGYSDVRTRAFSESGGDAALSGKSNSNRTATTTLGLHGEAAFDSAGAPGRLRATVGWRHAYGDVDPQATLAFQNSQSFTVTGSPIARDAAVVELGVDMAVSKRTTVGVTYAGQYGSGAKQSGGSLDVRFRF